MYMGMCEWVKVKVIVRARVRVRVQVKVKVKVPLQVKMEVEAVRGGRWPDLVVTLARSEGGAGGGALSGGNAPVLP